MKVPIHESEVAFETWYAGTTQEIRGKPLCDVGGQARVGFGLMELPPGSDTSPAHWHSKEEEHLYAIEGSASLFLGTQTFALVQGSYVCFPAGQPEGHYLRNVGEKPFKYIIVGEQINDDEVTYPTSAV